MEQPKKIFRAPQGALEPPKHEKHYKQALKNNRSTKNNLKRPSKPKKAPSEAIKPDLAMGTESVIKKALAVNIFPKLMCLLYFVCFCSSLIIAFSKPHFQHLTFKTLLLNQDYP